MNTLPQISRFDNAKNEIRRDHAKLEGVLREAGHSTTNGKVWRCCWHDDQRPSASIFRVDAVWKFRCFACDFTGDYFDILARIQGRPVAAVLREFIARSHAQNVQRRIVATYDYRNGFGDLVFQVVRFEPKDFRQRRPDGRGGWLWNITGVERVLYRLPELLNCAETDPDQPVFVVEGEKDCNALWARGLISTCNPCGAGQWRAEYNPALFRRRLRIIPDADAVGQAHAIAVARSIIEFHTRAGQIADVRIVALPGVGVSRAA